MSSVGEYVGVPGCCLPTNRGAYGSTTGSNTGAIISSGSSAASSAGTYDVGEFGTGNSVGDEGTSAEADSKTPPAV